MPTFLYCTHPRLEPGAGFTTPEGTYRSYNRTTQRSEVFAGLSTAPLFPIDLPDDSPWRDVFSFYSKNISASPTDPLGTPFFQVTEDLCSPFRLIKCRTLVIGATNTYQDSTHTVLVPESPVDSFRYELQAYFLVLKL
jgi:hypothetical protein